jgi:DNA-binding CsgD family transcriptional regulator
LSGIILMEGSYGVGPKEIVEILIETDGPVSARRLVEVSVHLPRRGTKWVASFRDERGRHIWRSTGLREREPALALGKRWEADAKRRRAAQPAVPTRLTIRVRPSSAERQQGCLTQAEVATFLRISQRTVREIERRALAKLRSHPALQDFWREWQTREIKETRLPIAKQWVLNRAEVAAVYALAETPAERQVLRKLLALTQGGS